jgi:hypothetical protein
MQVFAMASERATMGGPGCVMRIACSATPFHLETTDSAASETPYVIVVLAKAMAIAMDFLFK